MSAAMPFLYIARHGQTEWSLNGRHTGRTDIPLTAAGEGEARRLQGRLNGLSVAHVFVSPLQRARRTCELAGFANNAIVLDDLYEWNYGDYEGLRTSEILAARPGWELFRDGCPGGESPSDIAARADRLVKRVRDSNDSTIVFSSGHISRAVAVRWLGLPIGAGTKFQLSTASVSVMGYGHDLSEAAVHLWNDTSHLA